MIDIEEIIAEENRLLNQLIPVFVDQLKSICLMIRASTDRCACVDDCGDEVKKGDLSPLDVLANAFNSAIYAINEHRVY